LEHDAEGSPVGEEGGFVRGKGVAIEVEGTGVRPLEACDEAQEGGFSTAGGSYEDEAADGADLGIDVVEDVRAAEVFGELLEAKFQSGCGVRGAESRARWGW
jgi:hypothetical protein